MKKHAKIVSNNIEYTLTDYIGEGGSGVVWQAKSNEKFSAIKFLKAGLSKDKIERFQSELEFCKDKVHKNIITVISEGCYKGKKFYIMPYYPKNLRKTINECNDTTSLYQYVIQLAKAIKFIHGEGVVHRDIKPENVLINDDKELVLADFGIAHFIDSTLTETNDLLANRNYAAPEQRLKGSAKEIKKSADIYAFGLIINECFTKQAPIGSNYKLIRDEHPIYFQLDSLVEKMIEYDESRRFEINDIIIELNHIFETATIKLSRANKSLRTHEYPNTINEHILNKIYSTASQDLLFAKYLFENKTFEEIRSKYNGNWHMKIGYEVDDFLCNLTIQEKILSVCKHKFYYESNLYRHNSTYTPLDLNNNQEHKEIYQEFRDIVNQYPIYNEEYKLLDLRGQIFKYFSSCEDYHCKEILSKISNEGFIDDVNLTFESSPILSIIESLRYYLIESYDILMDRKFDLTNHIVINWGHTINYEVNTDDNQLYCEIHLKKMDEIDEVLNTFKRMFSISYSQIGLDLISIKFENREKFDEFRKLALNKYRSNDEITFGNIGGDILNILQKQNYIGDIVELILSQTFDVLYPLPIILGIKDSYN